MGEKNFATVFDQCQILYKNWTEWQQVLRIDEKKKIFSNMYVQRRAGEGYQQCVYSHLSNLVEALP